MAEYTTVLLDFDDTLVDTESLKNKAFDHFVSDKLKRPDILRKSGQSSIAVLRAGLSGEDSDVVDKICFDYNKFQFEFMSSSINSSNILFDDTVRFIEFLASSNFKYTVVTTSTREVFEMVSRKAGIIAYFDLAKVVTKSDVKSGLEKPHPYPYELAMSKLNVSKKECLIIEDSLSGLLSATDSGADVCFLNRKGESKDFDLNQVKYEVNGLDEVVGFLMK